MIGLVPITIQEMLGTGLLFALASYFLAKSIYDGFRAETIKKF